MFHVKSCFFEVRTSKLSYEKIYLKTSSSAFYRPQWQTELLEEVSSLNIEPFLVESFGLA